MKLITLPNGLRIFLNEEPHLRSATVGVWVAAGSRYEEDEVNGISHFIEHIVFKGSRKRTAFQIAEGMDEIGASVNAYTTKEYTFFYTKALDYQIIKAADILFDMLKNPRLDEKDIETEKGVVIEEMGMCEDDPEDVVYEINEENIFLGSGLSKAILGKRESVRGITKEKVLDYMNRFYVPERMIVGISGSFNEEELITKAKEYFGDLKGGDFLLKEGTVPFEKSIALKNMSTEQTHIIMSLPGIGIDHEDRYPLQICLFILGTGTSSMLYQRIREELGLVYNIDAWLGRYLGGGYIALTMGLSPQSEKRAIEEILGILLNFAERVTEKQVAIAKEKLIASLIMSREKPQSRFSSLGYSLLFLGKAVEDDEIIKAIKSVTQEKVREMAEKYFVKDKLSFAAVGKVRAREEYEKIIKEFEG